LREDLLLALCLQILLVSIDPDTGTSLGCNGLSIDIPTRSTGTLAHVHPLEFYHIPIPSAIPKAQAASTLPPMYSTFVLSPFALPSFSSNPSNNSPASTSKEVAITPPLRSSIVCLGPVTGTWTCSEHLPKPSGSNSWISPAWVDSAMTSWPVIPRATEPRATKRGMSDAGRNTLLVSSLFRS